MAENPGPSFQEWLEVLAHNKELGFAELKAMAKRIEDSTRLTEGQRADLLRRLGDLEVAAANRDDPLAHHDLKTGPSGS